MALENIMQIAGRAMDAQTIRMNLSVSNISNAENLAGSPTEAYKAKRPVFKEVMETEMDLSLIHISEPTRPY